MILKNLKIKISYNDLKDLERYPKAKRDVLEKSTEMLVSVQHLS